MLERTFARAVVAELIGTSALVFAGTVGLDPMFGGPTSGASVNRARSLGPALVAPDLHALWLYVAAPLVGAAAGALTYQFVRGEQARPAR